MQYKSDEEIKEYFRLLKQGNVEYREKIILNYMKLVPYIVVNRFNDKYDDDYIEEGYIGLIRAVDTYDCDKNIKFITYASRCIKNQILMYIRKLSKHDKVQSIYDARVTSEDGNDITIEDSLFDDSYDILNDYLIKERKIEVQRLLSVLDKKELMIVKLYYGFDGIMLTQKEISTLLGISQSYLSRLIRKIEAKLLVIYKSKTLTKHK